MFFILVLFSLRKKHKEVVLITCFSNIKRSIMKITNISFYFIGVALLSLLAGLLFGVIGGLQYILPEFLKDTFPFYKTRPVHVSLVITWIFTGAIGSIYYFISKFNNGKLFSLKLAQLHFIIFILTGLAILYCYFLGYFGGREYLEFPPIIALPMLFTWILFLINFFMTVDKKVRTWPVYYWMWSTGLLFFLITFGEAYLWTLSYFQNNIVRDTTVQWKAMGSMVGSWNMLVYGGGFYIMEQISGNKKIANSNITFFFYFLGLTNLMFNWGHHTYIVPAALWIKNVSYIISMTELLILGDIIWNWRKALSRAKKHKHLISYNLLTAADIWIFLNLILAIIISVPSINYYTHGTHITVAHSMGATIGINTMILFATIYFIYEQFNLIHKTKMVGTGFWITNISLFIFWLSLIGSGIVKALEKEKGTIFREMMEKLSAWFHVFSFAGAGIFTGILLISWPLFRCIFNIILSNGKMLIKENHL